MERWMDLRNIFDLKQWETLQNSLAETTKMAIITVDYKGRPMTKHSGCCDFCRMVREDETLGQYCQKCDSRGGLEAVRTNSPYIYECYFSIIDIAIPIIVNDQYIGALMAGQIRLAEEERSHTLMEQIYVPARQKQITEKRELLSREYGLIPQLSMEHIRMVSKMLYDLCGYIVSQSVHRHPASHNTFPADCLKESSTGAASRDNLLPQNDPGQKNRLRNMSINNPMIADVLDYLSAHKEDSPTLEQMAKYCNVSTGHLSRLFSREVGESFTSFSSRLKVEWAKSLLENTSNSITSISDSLGFSDAGYFIKIFKKYTGFTPAAYRTYLR